MKRLFGISLLFFVAINYANAQSSIGFSDPDDVQPILDYRLPDWGYSNFLLDFDFNGSGFQRESQSVPSSGRSTSLGLSPGYILFRESERRIFELRSNINLRYNGDYQKIETVFSEQEIENDIGNLRTVFSIDPSLKEYRSESVFLYGEAPFIINYRRFEDENKIDDVVTNRTTDIDRSITAVPRVGIGFGRIRNVTPIIRAVRLKERLSTVDSQINFGEQDVQSAADQFTRLDGYQRNYDRPSKYFWGDLDEDITADLSSLDTFDMLYVTDVLNEAVGGRLEGWEVITGIQFEYTNNLFRDEEETDEAGPVITRQTRREGLLGGFLSARWFKNTSLREQWGLFTNLDLRYSLKEENDPFATDLKRNLSLVAGVNWLYNISDRVLIQSVLANSYFRMKQELPESFVTEFNTWVNQITLTGQLNYFIENRIQLNLSVSPSLTYIGSADSEDQLDLRSFDWQIGAGLRYYFSRNLY